MTQSPAPYSAATRAEPADVVDHIRARPEKLSGNGRAAGVYADHSFGRRRTQRLHHRQKTLQLKGIRHRGRPGTRRFSAQIHDIRSFRKHLKGVSKGVFRPEISSTVAEGIPVDIQDSHDVGVRACFKGGGENFSAAFNSEDRRHRRRSRSSYPFPVHLLQKNSQEISPLRFRHFPVPRSPRRRKRQRTSLPRPLPQCRRLR